MNKVTISISNFPRELLENVYRQIKEKEAAQQNEAKKKGA